MKIFISYSSKNRDLVTSLANELTGLGHTVWFDQKLTGGQIWWNEILTNLEACDLFIFALTPQSLDSQPCAVEYGYAAALGKPILPVMIATISTNQLPSALSMIQIVDHRRMDTLATQDLSRALTTIVPAGPLPTPPPSRPPAPVSAMARLRDEVDAPTMNEQQQKLLVFDTKQFLRHPETASDARAILERLAQRSDLYATVADEIDDILLKAPTPLPAAPLPSLATQSQDQSQSQSSSSRWGLGIGVVIVVVVLLLGSGIVLNQFRAANNSTPTASSTSVIVFPAGTLTSSPVIGNPITPTATLSTSTLTALSPTPTLSQGNGDVPQQQSVNSLNAVVIRNQDSLTLYVPGNGSVSLNDIGYQIPDKPNGPPYTLQQLFTYAKFSWDKVPTPICLQLVRPGQTPPPAPDCPRNNLVVQPVSNIFWVDGQNSNRLTNLAVVRGTTQIATCPPKDSKCNISEK